MDIFKAEMNKACECGGIHCPCCNPWRNKSKGTRDKEKLNRLARHRIAQQDNKKFKNELDNN